MRCKRVFFILCWPRPVSDTKWFVVAGIRHKLICCGWYPTQNDLLRMVSDTNLFAAAGIRHKMFCRGWYPTQNELSLLESDTKWFVRIWHKLVLGWLVSYFIKIVHHNRLELVLLLAHSRYWHEHWLFGGHLAAQHWRSCHHCQLLARSCTAAGAFLGAICQIQWKAELHHWEGASPKQLTASCWLQITADSLHESLEGKHDTTCCYPVCVD